jgi:hypothetical protein
MPHDMKNCILKICFVLFTSCFYNGIPVPAATIILTSDQQLSDLQDPDKKIDLSTGFDKRFASLREICEEAKKRGDKSLVIAFDEFFRQYREQSGTLRRLTPDMDEYVLKIKKISDFAARYNMGIGLSLLSPLDIGQGFVNRTGQSGRWLHYTVGVRDSRTGRFNVQLWRQLYWTNNKGKIPLKLKGAQAFAFKEKVIANGRYSVVNPADIQRIGAGVKIEFYDTTSIVPAWEPSSLASDVTLPIQRVNICHEGDNMLQGYDRVFVMLEYETPEMDYFRPEVPDFLNTMLEKYHKAGINLTSLYSDEMHIQQDWYYFNHHDNGQLSVRYMTKNMATEYASRYGSEYADMDKYILYFVYGPKIVLNSPFAVNNTQYVMGDSPEAIHRTILFRDRYYKMLNNKVVEIFIEAKKYGESLYKRELHNGAHASWAQSPTIDLWDVGNLKLEAYQYEYTPNFIWANTVQQAAAACYDYFKWGDYLQPTGNDFAECGWGDRDYYGAAMSASIGVLNKYPNAYAAFWGMPDAVAERKWAVNSAFGCSATPTIKAITENLHRDVNVLILYPMNLVAAEERFGSWMTQYAYANYITAEKLIELGKLNADGSIEIAGRKYSTLVTLFEVIPPPALLDMMKQMGGSGGRVIWFGPPPVLDNRGISCIEKWNALFGVTYTPSWFPGQVAPGKQVTFMNRFNKVPSQIILTDFLVDHIYPVTLNTGSELEAEVDGMPVGSRKITGKGGMYYFGFRPRDDQSASLGYESATLFSILSSTGAYPATGKFHDVNDNTEYVSRTSDYLTTHFPNGSTVIVRHYRTHRENWLDGFSRNDSLDRIALNENPLPTDQITLKDFRVNGHSVSYSGRLITAFNTDPDGRLTSFEGHQCKEVTVDGKHYQLSDKVQPTIVWTQPDALEAKNLKAIQKVYVEGEGKISIPVPDGITGIRAVTGNEGKGKQKIIPGSLKNNVVTLDLSKEMSGRWIFICER